MRRLGLLVSVWLLAVPAWASDQIIVGGQDVNLGTANGSTEYHQLMGESSNDWGTTEATKDSPAGSAGDLKNLRVTITAAPGTGVTRTFTVRTSGAGTVTCAISGASATSCQDTTNTDTITAGTELSLEEVISGGNAAAADAHWTVQFDGSTAAESLLLGTNAAGGLSTTATEYGLMVGGADFSTTESNRYMIVSTGGTLKNLYVELDTAPGASSDRVFAVMVEGAATSLTCTVTDPATTCNDTTNTATVSEGNTVSIRQIPNALTAPAASDVEYGMTFVATTDGEFLLPGRDSGTSGTVSNEYLPLMGIQAGTTTETDADGLAQTMTITDMNVEIDGSPGVSPRAYDYFLRANAAVASTTCNIPAGSTTCAGETDSTIAADDLLDTEVDPSATAPTARTPLVCYTGFISQAATTRRIWSVQ